MNTVNAETYLEEIHPRLKDYLLSNKLFLPIQSGSALARKPYPNLTLGNIYLASKHLHDSEHPTPQIVYQVEELLNNWQVAAESKIDREFVARVRQWDEIIGDWKENAPIHSDQFQYEIRIRAIIQLLHMKNSADKKSINSLTALDGTFKLISKTGEFVWMGENQENFPEEHYWFLYRKLN